MNVMISVATYYPLIDGVQTITEYYAESLVKAGHNVTVLTSDCDGCLIKEERHSGVSIRRFRLKTSKSMYIGERDEYIRAVCELSASHDCWIAVCTQNAFTDLIIPHVAKLKCKTVLWLHGMAEFALPRVQQVSLGDLGRYALNNFRWRPFYYCAVRNIRHFDAVICLHNKDRSVSFLHKHGVEPSLILENGLVDDFNYQHDCRDLKSNSNYWLCVSNYSQQKNQELVLRAFAASNSKRRLIFVGSSRNSYYEKMQRLSKSLLKSDADRVKWLAGIDRADIVELISNAFAFISGSKIEKYPVVICEAMASGTPFVSTDVGIVRHLPGGLISNTVTSMAESVNKLETDLALWKRCSMSAINYARDFQKMQPNFLKLEKLLEDVVNGSAND